MSSAIDHCHNISCVNCCGKTLFTSMSKAFAQQAVQTSGLSFSVPFCSVTGLKINTGDVENGYFVTAFAFCEPFVSNAPL